MKIDNKSNKKIKPILIILVLVLLLICFKSITTIIKYNLRLEITQFAPQGTRQSMGYGLKTYNQNLIMIDGGTVEDTSHIEEYINKNGGEVEAWFITHLHDDHVGVLYKILQKKEIKINNIYLSLNNIEWYKTYEPDRAEFSENFIKLIQDENIVKNIKETQINQEIVLDNINCKILGIKNPEITTNAGNNQSMVISIKINDKSILFLGDTGIESQNKLLQQIDEKQLESYAVQMAHHGQNGVNKEFYQKVKPTICFWPTPNWLWENNSGLGEDTGPWKTKETRLWCEQLKINIHYVAKDGDKTVEIW